MMIFSELYRFVFFLYQIVIEGKFNSTGTPGTLALDDFFIHPRACGQIDTTPSPSTDFNCGDGTTVAQSSVW